MTLSSDSRKLRRLFFPYGLMILIMVIAGWCLRFYTYENHGEKLQEILESVPTEGVRDPGSTIQVGMTVENIYNFDEGLQTFDSDGWVWIIWSPEVERKMKERGMSAQDLFFSLTAWMIMTSRWFQIPSLPWGCRMAGIIKNTVTRGIFSSAISISGFIHFKP